MKLHTFTSERRLSKSDCTNRTSLRKPFYAMDYSLYTRTREATSDREKIIKEKGIRREHTDTYGSLWKMRDQSIDKLRKRWASQPGVTDGNGTRRWNRKVKMK